MQLGLFENLLSQSDKQSLILALGVENFYRQAFEVIESSNNYRSIELVMADLLEQLDIVQGYSLRVRDFIRLIRQIENSQARKLILGWYYCPFSYFYSKNIEFLSSLSNP